MVKTDETHLANFLAGRTGLSAEKSLKLMQILNSSRAQLERKFGSQFVTNQILELQERGRRVQFDGGGWVAGQSGIDPINSTSLTDTWKEGGEPSGDDVIDVLRQIDAIHAQARAAIADYSTKAAQAKVNKSGSTEPVRKVNQNDKASQPGSRGDMLDTPEKPKEQLEFVRKEREKAEETVKLQKQSEKERELMWTAKVEARRKELKAH